MKAKVNFTKQAIQALGPEAKRYNVLDSRTDGLGIVVHPSGRKTYFHCRKANSRPVRSTIGSAADLSIEQARKRAAELNAQLAGWKLAGSEGTYGERQVAATLGQLTDAYIQNYVPGRAKNPADRTRYVRGHAKRYFPEWAHRKLSSITRKDVLALHARIGDEFGRVIANRVLQLIATLYYYAERIEMFPGPNPARDLKDILFPEKSRDRFLDDAELARLFAALKTEPSRDLADFVTVALFTGARSGDIYAMQWKNLDLVNASWLIPNPKAKIPYLVPLMDSVVGILKARPKVSDYVFPGVGKTGHVISYDVQWARLKARAEISDLHIHDLRRTLGSVQAALGASLPIIGKSLGHQSAASTSVYARLQLQAVRASVVAATESMMKAAANG